ncbi:MAG: glycosyltransferase family 4 protein [Saprospiraceae bacterium]|nr:glycosyltransferase family 4 protein [Saprospiraceae bacterium]MCB9326345.1 glycosyltransferase family 4 protein [Lewinellaceae bacterium]
MNHKDHSLTFVVPPPASFHSGGNLYNAFLIEALKEEGVACSLTEPEKLTTGNKGTVFWDSLFLGRLEYLDSSASNWLIVHHLESLYPPEGFSSAQWFEQEERRLLEQFDGFLVSSPFTAAYLRGKNLGDQDILVIEPALLFELETPKRQVKSIRALMVANLQERKGIFPFLEALAVHEPGFDFSLTIAGSAAMEPGYAKKCMDFMESEPNLGGKVFYEGAKTPQEIRALYWEANLFISTAFMETYGMALQEAAATGLPLLVMKGGNAGNHVIEGQNGLVFETIPQLVQELNVLAKDLKKLSWLGENAARLAKNNHYSWKDAAKLLINHLK